MVDTVAGAVGLGDRLHFWPDKALGSQKVVDRQPDPTAYRAWLSRWWTRKSEWPSEALKPVLVRDACHAPGAQPDVALASAAAAETEIVPALTPDEQTFLVERETTVSSGLCAALQVARALHEIHSYEDGKLWKSSHRKFEAYCRARFRISKSHAYRLLGTGAFLASLTNEQSPRGDCWLPQAEIQVRHLLKLPEPDRIPTWKSMVEGTPVEKITGPMVAARVREKLATSSGPKPDAEALEIGAACATAAKLRDQLARLPIHPGLLAAFDGIRAHLRDLGAPSVS